MRMGSEWDFVPRFYFGNSRGKDRRSAGGRVGNSILGHECTRISTNGIESKREAELRRQVRSRVQLGNEPRKEFLHAESRRTRRGRGREKARRGASHAETRRARRGRGRGVRQESNLMHGAHQIGKRGRRKEAIWRERFLAGSRYVPSEGKNCRSFGIRKPRGEELTLYNGVV